MAVHPPTLVYGRTAGGDNVPLRVDSNGNLLITASVSGADGSLLDGVDGNIKATVFDLTGSNPLATAIVDGSGNQITSFGGGTQYTEDAAAAANPVGTALILVREDARAGGLTTTDGDNVAARGNNKGELYVKHTDIVDVETEEQLDYDTGAGTVPVSLIGIALPASGGPVAGGTSTNPIRVDPTGTTTQPVSLASVPSHAVTNAGTFAVQATEADGANVTLGSKADAKSTATDTTAITIMQVLKQISASVQAPPSQAVTNAGTFVTQENGAALTSLQLIDDVIFAEDVGHTTGDKGIMALAVRNDTPNAALTSADLDYAAIAVNRNGAVRIATIEDDFAAQGGNQVKKYYTNAGAVTDGIVWSPAAGKRWYITDIFINVSAAATVTLEDDLTGGDSAVWKAELAANSGWSHSFATPLFSGEDAADLLVTTSAGNVYIMVTGYEI